MIDLDRQIHDYYDRITIPVTTDEYTRMATGAPVVQRRSRAWVPAAAQTRAKRGGGRQRISLDEQIILSPRHDEDLLAVDQLLAELEEIDQRQAKIVELRFFGGMTGAEVAVR